MNAADGRTKPATEKPDGAVDTLDIVFSEAPGPESDFVEVENSSGESVRIGEWVKRPDGYWVLRIPDFRQLACELQEARKELLTTSHVAWREANEHNKMPLRERLVEQRKRYQAKLAEVERYQAKLAEVERAEQAEAKLKSSGEAMTAQPERCGRCGGTERIPITVLGWTSGQTDMSKPCPSCQPTTDRVVLLQDHTDDCPFVKTHGHDPCTCGVLNRQPATEKPDKQADVETVITALLAVASAIEDGDFFVLSHWQRKHVRLKNHVQAIRQLARQLAEAREELRPMKIGLAASGRKSMAHWMIELHERAEQAEAEVERLRDVLNVAKIRFDIRQADKKPMDDLDIAVGAAIIGIREDRAAIADTERTDG